MELIKKTLSLLTLILILGPYAQAAEPVPYSIFMVKAGYPAIHPRCAQIFNPMSSYSMYTSYQHGKLHEMTVQDGFVEPYYQKNGGVMPVSAFFKMKVDTYSGMWHWRPAEFRQSTNKMNENNDYFFGKWQTEFKLNPKKVSELNEIANNTNPLRKAHIGLRMREVPWAEVVLFDGSTKLKVFNEKGELAEAIDPFSNRSEMEVRFPELKLPERAREEQGEDVQVFFLSRLTSLEKIQHSINDLYHEVALQILLRTNGHLLESQNKRDDFEDLQQQYRYSLPPFLKPFTGYNLPSKPSPRRVFLPQEKWQEAFFNLRDVMIYGPATKDMAAVHSKFGWKVLDEYTDKLNEPDMVIIGFKAIEFIERYLFMNYPESGPVASAKGKESEEYVEQQRLDQEYYKEIQKRARAYMNQFE